MLTAAGTSRGDVTKVVLAVGSVAAVMLLAVAVGGEKARGQGAADGGRELYEQNCASCHGATGEGTFRGPPITGSGAAGAHFWLSTGRMPISDPQQEPRRSPPAFAGEDLDALVDYVASLGDGPPIPAVSPSAGDLSEGEQLYRRNCAACHSWAGVGGALIANQAAPGLHPSTPTQVAEAIRIGPGTMPVFNDDVLDDAELNAVVAYVAYLKRPLDRGGAPLSHLGPFAEGFTAAAALGVLLLASLWIGKRT